MRGMTGFTAAALAAAIITTFPVGAAIAQEGTVVESFTLDAIDNETSEYQVVAGGQYGLLMKGTLSDSAGAQFDSLYCRNDVCGGAGTYVDNIVGMGLTDPSRQPYPGSFGPMTRWFQPLPLFFSNSSGYAARFTAPLSGRLQFITNHGNSSSRPIRSGTLQFDLYRYSEPPRGGGAGGGGTTTGSTSTANPCGSLAAALAGTAPAPTRARAARDGDPCPPDHRNGTVFTAPAPGRTRTIYSKIGRRATKAVVTVANGATGTVLIGVAGRRQRARRTFETYAHWCLLGLYLNPNQSARFNGAVFGVVFGFKTGRAETGSQALCQYAAIVATVRAIEAEDAARANPPQVPAGPPSNNACRVGRVVATSRTGGVTTNVSRTEMPGLRISQTCKHAPPGVMQITYTATGGRTLSQELGSTRMPITIARGRDGQPGGTLAIRSKPSR